MTPEREEADRLLRVARRDRENPGLAPFLHTNKLPVIESSSPVSPSCC